MVNFYSGYLSAQQDVDLKTVIGKVFVKKTIVAFLYCAF